MNFIPGSFKIWNLPLEVWRYLNFTPWYFKVWILPYWGQNFHATWLYFIGNPHHIHIIMNFWKIYFKAQKSPYLHKMMPKPIVQNPWQYYFIKAHGSSSWNIISFSAYDPSSRVSSGKFWELWFGGPKNMFSIASMVQSW